MLYTCTVPGPVGPTRPRVRLTEAVTMLVLGPLGMADRSNWSIPWAGIPFTRPTGMEAAVPKFLGGVLLAIWVSNTVPEAPGRRIERQAWADVSPCFAS